MKRPPFKFHVLKLVLGLFAVGAIQSCSNSKPSLSPTDEFTGVDSLYLSGKDIPLESDTSLYDPRTIDVFDSVAVVSDNSNVFGYSVINVKTGKLIKRFAYASDEKTNMDFQSLTLNSVNNGFNEFSILQANKPSRLFHYDLDSLLLMEKYNPTIYNLPDKVNYITAVFDRNKVFGRSNFSELDNNLFSAIDVNKNVLYTGISLPKLKNSKNDYQKEALPWLISMLGGKIKRRPKSDDYAYFSTKGALIQIINNKNIKDFKVIHEKLFYLPAFKLLKKGNVTQSLLLPGCKNGFNDLAVTKDRIYALFNGKDATSDDTDNLCSNLLLVYDWQGKPIKKIQLDQSFYSISFSEATNELYCLRSFQNIGIRKYKLPE